MENMELSIGAAYRPEICEKKYAPISSNLIDAGGRIEIFGLLEDPEKTCDCCEESWPVTTEFWHKRVKAEDGFSNTCKACMVEKRLEVKAQPKQEPSCETMHLCLSCGESKKLCSENFHRHGSRKNGFAARCKPCANARITARRALKPGEKLPKLVMPAKLKLTEKACNYCKSTYPLTAEYWYRKAATSDGFATQCKLCEKALQKASRAQAAAA